MNVDFSRIAPPGRFPRLLITADYASTVEPLLRTFRDSRLDVDFDLCTSQTSAVRKLLASPYELIIAGARLAEMDDYFLLKRSQSLEGFVPFVITASVSEKQSARRVLAQGAFDLIPTPIDHEQTISTILLALWQSKLRSLMACKERVFERYCEHLAHYPGDRTRVEKLFGPTLLAFEKTISGVQRSLLLIDESAGCLIDCAMKLEQDARTTAFARLDSLAT